MIWIFLIWILREQVLYEIKFNSRLTGFFFFDCFYFISVLITKKWENAWLSMFLNSVLTNDYKIIGSNSSKFIFCHFSRIEVQQMSHWVKVNVEAGLHFFGRGGSIWKFLSFSFTASRSAPYSWACGPLSPSSKPGPLHI